jgi:PqqD family protein of HPr-rel-A system
MAEPGVIEGSWRVTASQTVTADAVGGETVLHNAATGRAHALNVSASRLWELCRDRPRVDALIDALARSYGLAADEVRQDVVAALAELRARGLVELRASGGRVGPRD